jgi:hypothetical protein
MRERKIRIDGNGLVHVSVGAQGRAVVKKQYTVAAGLSRQSNERETIPRRPVQVSGPIWIHFEGS